MHLTLMRHGEPARASDNPVDPELSVRGVEQARRAARYLGNEPIDHIYSSPQRRARETAAVVAEALGLPVIVDEGLAEFDYGSTYVHYDATSPVWRSYFAGDLTPWGLTADSFHDRIGVVCDKFVGQHRGRGVLAVCHGGVINAWTCQVLGVRDRLRLMEPAYASLHRYAHVDGVWRVVALNEAPALDIDN